MKQWSSPDSEYEAALALASDLDHRSTTATQEETLLELLLTLIEKYETIHAPIPVASGSSVLHHLMEAQDLNANDLIGILGNRAIVEQILTDQQNISPTQAQSLAERLNVTAEVFL